MSKSVRNLSAPVAGVNFQAWRQGDDEAYVTTTADLVEGCYTLFGFDNSWKIPNTLKGRVVDKDISEAVKSVNVPRRKRDGDILFHSFSPDTSRLHEKRKFIGVSVQYCTYGLDRKNVEESGMNFFQKLLRNPQVPPVTNIIIPADSFTQHCDKNERDFYESFLSGLLAELLTSGHKDPVNIIFCSPLVNEDLLASSLARAEAIRKIKSAEASEVVAAPKEVDNHRGVGSMMRLARDGDLNFGTAATAAAAKRKMDEKNPKKYPDHNAPPAAAVITDAMAQRKADLAAKLGFVEKKGPAQASESPSALQEPAQAAVAALPTTGFVPPPPPLPGQGAIPLAPGFITAAAANISAPLQSGQVVAAGFVPPPPPPPPPLPSQAAGFPPPPPPMPEQANVAASAPPAPAQATVSAEATNVPTVTRSQEPRIVRHETQRKRPGPLASAVEQAEEQAVFSPAALSPGVVGLQIDDIGESEYTPTPTARENPMFDPAEPLSPDPSKLTIDPQSDPDESEDEHDEHQYHTDGKGMMTYAQWRETKRVGRGVLGATVGESSDSPPPPLPATAPTPAAAPAAATPTPDAAAQRTDSEVESEGEETDTEEQEEATVLTPAEARARWNAMAAAAAPSSTPNSPRMGGRNPAQGKDGARTK